MRLGLAGIGVVVGKSIWRYDWNVCYMQCLFSLFLISSEISTKRRFGITIYSGYSGISAVASRALYSRRPVGIHIHLGFHSIASHRHAIYAVAAAGGNFKG